MKKFLTILLSLMMVFCLFVPVFALENNENSPSDTGISAQTVEAEEPVEEQTGSSENGGGSEITSGAVTTKENGTAVLSEETGEGGNAEGQQNEPATYTINVKSFVGTESGEFVLYKDEIGIKLGVMESGKLGYLINKYESDETGQYVFNKFNLYEIVDGSEVEIKNDIESTQDEYNVFVSWDKEDLSSSSEYMLKIFYDSTDVIDMGIFGEKENDKLSLCFCFYHNDMFKKVQEEGYAYYIVEGDESGEKHNLDLNKFELFEVEDGEYWCYSTEMDSELSDKTMSVTVYVPGYFIQNVSAGFYAKYNIFSSYYLEDDKSFIWTDPNPQRRHAEDIVELWGGTWESDKRDVYDISYFEVDGKTFAIESEASPVVFEMPDHDVNVKVYCKLKEKNIEEGVHLTADYIKYKGNLLKCIEVGGTPELVKLIHEKGVIHYGGLNSDFKGSIVLKDYDSDSVILNDYDENYSNYVYILNDEDFVGDIGFSLKMEGYVDYDFKTIFTEPHKLTYKRYVDGVLISEDSSYHSEGTHVGFLHMEDGVYTMEFESDVTTYKLDKIVVSPDSYAEHLRTDKYDYVDENDQKHEAVNYDYVMGDDDAIVSIYFKSLTNVYVQGGVDESVNSDLMKAVKNKDAKLIAYGDFEITEELLSSLDTIGVDVWTPLDEHIGDKDVFDAKIESVTGENKYVGFIEINIIATNGNEYVGLLELKNPVEVKVVLSDEVYDSIKDKDNIKVLRQHYDIDGNIVYDFLPDADVKLEGRVLTIRSDKFSTYAVIGYDNPVIVDDSINETYQKPVLKPVVNTSVR